ncbi:Bug family tripartite tricarboxylate transporter substrate binding protein [Teichococcus aestuarii]|uniref:Bug family tripartite tricarboxylate transporter substrate binding protein n=1 Tax=Teichococcus aestuarii TaxID=568898 RepID=UPI003617C5F4
MALAREKPGHLNYGSSGSGSVNHLLTELLLQRAGAQMTHIPFRGAGPALLELRTGRIDLFYATPLDVRPLVQEGKARLLAISSPGRIPSLPELPSVAESFEGCAGVLWQGLFAPAGTPPPVLERLHGALRAALADPALRARVENQGVVLMDGDAAALRQRRRRRWRSGRPSSARPASRPAEHTGPRGISAAPRNPGRGCGA